MKTSPMPTEKVLCGILFNITVHEGLIVFEEAICISGFHERIAFTRTDYSGGGCWYVETSSNKGAVMASHITEAYKLVCEVYGKDFEEKIPL